MKGGDEMEKQVEWADASALGFWGVAVAIVPLCCQALGWIPVESGPLLIPWLILGGLVVSVAGIIQLKKGDLPGGSAFFLFGILFLITPGVCNIINLWAGMVGMAIPQGVSGVAWLVLGVILIATSFVMGLGSWISFVFVMLVAIAVLLFGAFFLGAPPICLTVAGWMGLLFSLEMLYMGIGVFLFQNFGRQILPLGKPLFKIKQS